MDDRAMEDYDDLLPVWRANLVLLTRELGASTRLARMMTFSHSYLKLMLAGQRNFSEEFVRGVESVTGLPHNWMNTPHAESEIPGEARRAIDTEAPLARFRGTAHPTRKRSVLRPPEPIFGHTPAARRTEDVTPVDIGQHRRLLHVRKVRDLAVQDVRRYERHMGHPPVELATLRTKVEELIADAELDDAVQADLEGRLEQIDKHRLMLLTHIEKLQALLMNVGET
jgi:hypothetical protein